MVFLYGWKRGCRVTDSPFLFGPKKKILQNNFVVLQNYVPLYRYQLQTAKLLPHMDASTQSTAANEILAQLGGRKFIAMTGATCYSDNNGNTLVVKFKGSKVANIMYVTLNVMDTYDVKICKYKGLEVKPVKEVEGVYDDMLKSIFEETTGLRTSL